MKRFDAIIFKQSYKKFKVRYPKANKAMNNFPIFYDGWSQFSKDEILQIRNVI